VARCADASPDPRRRSDGVRTPQLMENLAQIFHGARGDNGEIKPVWRRLSPPTYLWGWITYLSEFKAPSASSSSRTASISSSVKSVFGPNFAISLASIIASQAFSKASCSAVSGCKPRLSREGLGGSPPRAFFGRFGLVMLSYPKCVVSRQGIENRTQSASNGCAPDMRTGALRR
jgi:hypothetical protein